MWQIWTVVALLIWTLIRALVRAHARIAAPPPPDPLRDRLFGPDPDPIPHSLRRGNFSAATRRQASTRYARAQLVALGEPDPSAADVAAAADRFDREVRGPRGAEFHLRHVVADSFLRRSVAYVLRAPTDVQLQAVREVFEAMEARDLLVVWDDISAVLRAGGAAGANWYQRLGARRVADLRRALNDTVGQLFFSESQGNLLVGTHVDVTGDALATLTVAQVERITQSSARLMDGLGLQPRLVTIENEIVLGYTGATGAYRHYGYDPARSHDTPEDPLRTLTYGQSLGALSRADRRTVLRYLWRYQRNKLVLALVTVLGAIYARLLLSSEYTGAS